MATLTPSPWMHFEDNNGVPLSGGKVYTYLSGTTTPAFTKTDYTGLVNNTNPVILNSRGEAAIWLDESTVYRFVLTTSTDVTISTSDGISSVVYPSARGQTRFVSNGSFTVPTGITKIWISGVAGGGAGGGGGSNAVTGYFGGAGGGGGAGQGAFKKFQTVTPGEVIPITIGLGGVNDATHGQGGVAGSDNAYNGADGTDTIIGTYLTLLHGGGGFKGSSSSVTSNNGLGGPGGFGGVFGALIDGQQGGYGGVGGNVGGLAINCFGGDGGSNMFGAGGRGIRNETVSAADNGRPGHGYGSGGSGGGVSIVNPSNGGNGGNGANGMVLIEW